MLVFDLDYDDNTLAQTDIYMTIDPSRTTNPLITHIPQQSFKLKLGNTITDEIMIYNYSVSTYQLKHNITLFALIIGILSLVMVFLGFFSPFGKFTIFQTLTVVQMAYFGLLQFQHLPITFEGLKYLSLSNGFNTNSLST